MISPDDIRYIIFRNIINKKFKAVIVSEGEGILAGMERLKKKAEDMGIEIQKILPSGAAVKKGDIIVEFYGNPLQIAVAEDILIGIVAKASGVATAARRAVAVAQGRIRVVCGAWKKMPIEIKDLLREAILIGGAGIRLVDKPFIYIDKNYVRMFGGIRQALEAVKHIGNRIKAIQVRGEFKDIAEEALEAAYYGADVVMVDTGNISDLEKVHKALEKAGIRNSIQIAFGGNIKIEQIPEIVEKGANIVDIGKAIIDAPLLDLKLDVIAE
jgi:nicotinate-nucleotide pyrophosphorylase (carboxylating)